VSEDALLTALRRTRLGELPERCGADAAPGLAIEDEWRDWSSQPTTPDQLAIERYLAGHDLSEKRILHVGVGNSSLARRFAGRAKEIVGLTVAPEEFALAERLAIANYRVVLHNKHLGADAGVRGPFDFIVDNNPTTFACCLTHFAAMLGSYAAMLAPDGQILTERRGLAWVHDETCDPRWSFDFTDWAAAGAPLGLRAWRRGGVYVLARRRPALPAPSFWLGLARQRIAAALAPLAAGAD